MTFRPALERWACGLGAAVAEIDGGRLRVELRPATGRDDSVDVFPDPVPGWVRVQACMARGHVETWRMPEVDLASHLAGIGRILDDWDSFLSCEGLPKIPPPSG